jgi:hypothetical protein
MMAGGTAPGLSIEEERRVRLGRLSEAMTRGQPPALPNPQFHLYAEERLYAVRPVRRLEYFGANASPPAACFGGFGRPLFRPGGSGAPVYMAPAQTEQPAQSSREWHELGGGRLHLTSWRFAFQGETGDWLDFPFDAITWSECYAGGLGLCAANWSPMYFETAYPEWLYAYYRFLFSREVPVVQIPAELDTRARGLGM